MEKELSGKERLERFLEGKYGKTADGYRNSLKRFFFNVYGDNTLSELEERKALKGFDLENAVDRYFREERDYEEDVRQFLLKYQKGQSSTFKVYKINLKMFLERQRIVLPDFAYRDVKITKDSKEDTKDKVPTLNELREILDPMPPQGKALFTMLASSGMRIGEGLKLEMADICDWLTVDLEDEARIYKDFKQIPLKPLVFKLQSKKTKTSTKRIVIVSTEAVSFLKAWLAYRPEYLKTAVSRSRYDKEIEDKRIFPFDDATAYSIWESALKKAGKFEVDENTKRLVYHPHGLRKFFRTRSNFENTDVAEVLMGHQTGLNEIYARLADDLETLYAHYQKIEQNLTAYKNGNGVDVKKIRAELEQKIEETSRKSREELQSLVNRLTNQNMSLSEKMEKMESEQRVQRDLLEVMEQKWKELEQEIEADREIDATKNLPQ